MAIVNMLKKTVGGASVSAVAALTFALAAPLTVGAAHAETTGNPSTGQNSSPAYVTFGQADGTVGNDKVHIMALPDTDAIVLESNGHFGIVDSAEDDDYADGSDARYPWRDGIATWGYTSNVDAYLQKLGVNSSNLDFYIGTHSHSDHIGNADTIIYKYRPKRIYTPQYSDSYITDKSRLWDNQKVYDDMIRAANWAWAAYGGTLDQHVTPGYNDTIQMGDMRIQIIPTDPNENYKRTGVPDANLIAYTAKVTAHGRSAYLSADLETTNGQEDYVAPIVGHVDWLKSPHHGLPSSSNNGFVEKLSPKLVMQTGYEFQSHDGAVAGATRGQYEWFEAYSMKKAGYDALVGTFTPGGITRPNYLVGMGHVFDKTSKRTWWFYNGGPWARTGWWEGHYGGWHYFNNSATAVQNGWVNSGGSWYWMGADSFMATNAWVNDGGSWYRVGGDGKMLSGGWTKIDGSWYYLSASGRAYTGWLYVGGKWYYMDPSSAKMREAWVNDGSGWYWMTPGSGAMIGAGWHSLWGNWHYMDGNGRAVTGWNAIGGSWYYMDPATTAMKTGWVNDGTGWYYLKPSGVMQGGGWARIDGSWYLFYGNGMMRTGTVFDGGKWWNLGSNGKLQ